MGAAVVATAAVVAVARPKRLSLAAGAEVVAAAAAVAAAAQTKRLSLAVGPGVVAGAPAEVVAAQIVVAVPAVAMAAGRKRLLITAAAVATAARMKRLSLAVGAGVVTSAPSEVVAAQIVAAAPAVAMAAGPKCLLVTVVAPSVPASLPNTPSFCVFCYLHDFRQPSSSTTYKTRSASKSPIHTKSDCPAVRSHRKFPSVPASLSIAPCSCVSRYIYDFR